MLDNTLKPLIKKTLSLPSNSANEFIWERRDNGLFAIPLTAEDSDIVLIDGGFKLLTSNDKIIKSLAWYELVDIANCRYQSTSNQNMEKYFNSSPADRTLDQYRSTWSRARLATDRLGLRWNVTDVYQAELKIGDDVLSNRRSIFRTIRKHLREKCTQELRDHPHQGKTNTCVAAAKSSRHFFTTNMYTTFKDRTFVHRARLGLFNKLNAINKARGHTNKKCRKCTQMETLPHVLNHCMVHSTLYIVQETPQCSG